MIKIHRKRALRIAALIMAAVFAVISSLTYLADYVLGVLTRAQHEGALSASTQPRDMTVIFLNGMFALLTTLAASAGTRRKLLDQYVKTMVTGMEAL